MYSELFDQLGARSSRESNAANNASSSATSPAPLVSFHAGRMELKKRQEPLQYQCEPLKTRGEVRLVWKSNALQWQFYDRRDKKVLETHAVADYPHSTFERISLADQKQQRVFVWTRPTDQENPHLMYWMQDISDEKDDQITATVNQYLSDPKSAAPEGSAAAMETEETANSNANAPAASTSTTTTTTEGQVDALSSILENLGMPQGNNNLSTDAPAAAPTGTLTLADLQGAMAGISAPPTAGPALSEVVTPEAITGILADEAACQRLMELLPPEQRTPEQLQDNLRSPQVQQTLRSLTATLLPDETGDMSGLYSVLANFQLDPADAQAAIAQGNPIQAFLDALMKSVQKEQEEESKNEE